MIDSLSVAVHVFASHVLMSVSDDETLLPRLVNLSTPFFFWSAVIFLNFYAVSNFIFIHLLQYGVRGKELKVWVKYIYKTVKFGRKQSTQMNV